MSALDTLASQIPQELRVKLMQHFGIAKEYEKNPETISITYYCLMYIANEALKLQKEKQFVSNVIDYLEATKRNNPGDEIIRSMQTGQATIEELVTVLVGETNEAEDGEIKTPDQLRLLMRKHYTVGGLTDVLSVFGPVKEDFSTLGRIAKSRAVAIFRDLKAGGSGGGGGAAAAIRPADSNTGGGARAISPSKPPPASIQPPTQMPQVPSSHAAASFYDQSGSNTSVPFDVINQAQKLCRYANSALEHEDIATAVKNCEQVLQLLRPYNH
jgi:vacuolar protein sorting-associated protein VTA1